MPCILPNKYSQTNTCPLKFEAYFLTYIFHLTYFTQSTNYSIHAEKNGMLLFPYKKTNILNAIWFSTVHYVFASCWDNLFFGESYTLYIDIKFQKEILQKSFKSY